MAKRRDQKQYGIRISPELDEKIERLKTHLSTPYTKISTQGVFEAAIDLALEGLEGANTSSQGANTE